MNQPGLVTAANTLRDSAASATAGKGKTILVLVVVAVVTIASVAAIFGRTPRSAGVPNLEGDWSSWRSSFRIRKAEGRYTIDVTSPDGFLGGRYVGDAHDGAIHVKGPLSALCGQIRYVKEGDKLEFCGEEFERRGSMAPGGGTAHQ